MKPSFLQIGAILLTMALSSCSKEDQLYSCDPAVDKWVKENLQDISKMTRSQWLELNIPYAAPTYAAFTPQQKYDFWISKINEVLTMDWNKDEKNHIQLIIIFIDNNRDVFEDNARENQKTYDAVDLFQYNWCSYAKEKLGWSPELMEGIIADGHQLIDKNGNLYIKSTTGIKIVTTRSEGPRLECNCNLASIWYGSCADDPCDSTLTGCGTLTFYECDGRHRP